MILKGNLSKAAILGNDFSSGPVNFAAELPVNAKTVKILMN